MDSNQQIILRRFIMFPHSGESEPVKFETIKQVGSADFDIESNLCQIESRVEKDICFYKLNFSRKFKVIPVDWRRFSYDHTKVRGLLSDCIKDNISPYLFDPLPKEVLGKIETTLILALQDLQSIFEVITLNCETKFDSTIVVVTVDGEHKNGERVIYVDEIKTFLNT